MRLGVFMEGGFAATIVLACLTEQTERADRCEQIAHDAAHRARR